MAEKVKSTLGTKIMIGVVSFVTIIAVLMGTVSFLDTPSKAKRSTSKARTTAESPF